MILAYYTNTSKIIPCNVTLLKVFHYNVSVEISLYYLLESMGVDNNLSVVAVGGRFLFIHDIQVLSI